MVKEPLSESVLAKIFKTSPQNPEKLIKREDKNHEFKESYNNGSMASYLKTMAAFANNDGGYIVFGITDSPRLLKGLDEKGYKVMDCIQVLPDEDGLKGKTYRVVNVSKVYAEEVI